MVSLENRLNFISYLILKCSDVDGMLMDEDFRERKNCGIGMIFEGSFFYLDPPH